METLEEETVQVIPHITNEIKSRFYRAKSPDENRIAIIEVGGTVGDIESQPFLESIRQFQHDVGHEKCNPYPCNPDSIPESFRRNEDKTDTGKCQKNFREWESSRMFWYAEVNIR